MKEKIEALVLGSIPYSDTHRIATLYTRERGRMVCFVRTAKGKTRSGALQPLSWIEGAVSLSPGRDMARLMSYNIFHPWKRIYSDPMRTSVGLFISEFLSRLLREQTPDEALWKFLANALKTFDESKAFMPNFHIALVAHISIYAGIFPDVGDYTPDSFFDLREGRYTFRVPGHKEYLPSTLSRIPLMLSRMSIEHSNLFHLSGRLRSELLEGILKYYALHFPGMDSLKSPSVLRSIFSN